MRLKLWIGLCKLHSPVTGVSYHQLEAVAPCSVPRVFCDALLHSIYIFLTRFWDCFGLKPLCAIPAAVRCGCTLGLAQGITWPSAQSPVELLWCEGLWLGHSSKGWYMGYLGQSIPWADPQLCRGMEWLGRVQQAQTSLSLHPCWIKVPVTGTVQRCCAIAFLKRVKALGLIINHSLHPSLHPSVPPELFDVPPPPPSPPTAPALGSCDRAQQGPGSCSNKENAIK